MATVETVLGPVEAAELGRTLAHEHLRTSDEAVRDQWPGRYDEQEEHDIAVQAIAAAQEHGIKTIVDPTAMFLGRDVEFMAKVSEAAGVNVVACTGIYTYDHLPEYFANRSEDQIAEHFIDDIQVGIQGTAIKAAFLKCAADEPGVNANVEKVHRAVARASVQTGAPIIAHSRPASQTGPRQVEIFEQEGVDLSRVVIAHCGDTDDVDYIEGLLAKGVYVGLDRYGLNLFLPTAQRNPTTIELLRRGHVERLHISQDFCMTIDYYPPEVRTVIEASDALDNWSLTMIFEHVFPVLREAGVLDDGVEETLLVDNPRRWLTGA
jgi:phosphotriesterase-related protein